MDRICKNVRRVWRAARSRLCAVFLFSALFCSVLYTLSTKTNAVYIQDGQEVRFAVTLRDSGRVIGSAGFTGRQRGGGQREDELGYALHPRWWGQGLMTEACRKLIEYGFSEMGLESIWCTHYDGNDRSRRVIEKCGFQKAFSQVLYDEFGEHLTHFYFLLREDRRNS